MRPNSDTLYSMGMLNVEDGYVVIRLPKSDHYMSMMVYESDHYLADDGVINNEQRPIYGANSKISTPNADSSFTVNFSSCEDGGLNCVPVGEGSWNMTWRYYGPEGAIADNNWKHIQPMPVK